jgi:hypothetical protein
MKVSYQYRKEDYLSALMLQAANSRKDACCCSWRENRRGLRCVI